MGNKRHRLDSARFIHLPWPKFAHHYPSSSQASIYPAWRGLLGFSKPARLLVYHATGSRNLAVAGGDFRLTPLAEDEVAQPLLYGQPRGRGLCERRVAGFFNADGSAEKAPSGGGAFYSLMLRLRWSGSLAQRLSWRRGLGRNLASRRDLAAGGRAEATYVHSNMLTYVHI